jgi:hypothetical protein
MISHVWLAENKIYLDRRCSVYSCLIHCAKNNRHATILTSAYQTESVLFSDYIPLGKQATSLPAQR